MIDFCRDKISQAFLTNVKKNVNCSNFLESVRCNFLDGIIIKDRSKFSVNSRSLWVCLLCGPVSTEELGQL